MKLLMLNDNRAHPNWGAQATPHAIDVLFDDQLPGCERRWLAWDWLRSRHRVLDAPFSRRFYEPSKAGWKRRILARFSRPFSSFPTIVDDFDRFADEWMAGGGGPMADHFMAELNERDALVYNGENSLYRNTLEGKRALFLMWFSKTRLGKPTCIINHTAHMTGVLPVMNGMIRKVHPRLDLVTCREAASHRALVDMGITSAELVPDVVFWLPESEPATTRVEDWLTAHELHPQRFVCMSASGLGVSRPRDDWDGEYCHLVRAVQQRAGLRTVLMARDAHCQFLADVARRTGAAYFGPEHHFTDLWPLLRQAAALVTGHFHYAIIASIGGCPFVPLSANNHKIAGLSEMLQWKPLQPFDATDLATCGEAIADRTAEIISGRQEYSQQLSGRARELRGRLASLPDRVRAAMESA